MRAKNTGVQSFSAFSKILILIILTIYNDYFVHLLFQNCTQSSSLWDTRQFNDPTFVCHSSLDNNFQISGNLCLQLFLKYCLSIFILWPTLILPLKQTTNVTSSRETPLLYPGMVRASSWSLIRAHGACGIILDLLCWIPTVMSWIVTLPLPPNKKDMLNS